MYSYARNLYAKAPPAIMTITAMAIIIIEGDEEESAEEKSIKKHINI